jgi:hypothetical protein
MKNNLIKISVYTSAFFASCAVMAICTYLILSTFGGVLQENSFDEIKSCSEQIENYTVEVISFNGRKELSISKDSELIYRKYLGFLELEYLNAQVGNTSVKNRQNRSGKFCNLKLVNLRDVDILGNTFVIKENNEVLDLNPREFDLVGELTRKYRQEFDIQNEDVVLLEFKSIEFDEVKVVVTYDITVHDFENYEYSTAKFFYNYDNNSVWDLLNE